MSAPASSVRRSYLKSLVACLAVLVIALLLLMFALLWLPGLLAAIMAALAGLVALVAAVLSSACAVVWARCRRNARGETDLFLLLNRSREAAAIQAAAPARVAPLRRRLAQWLLGHELLVGDLVEVRPWTEIRGTLDESGCLEQLPFMPEMLALCGQRARVFRCAHRIFDYRKTRVMRHMEGTVLLAGRVCSGANHGGCEAACHTIWKAAWLRRIDPTADAADSSLATQAQAAGVAAIPGMAAVQIGATARYTCQLTQLHAASQAIGKRSFRNFLRPLICGNVLPAAFAVGWLTHCFNKMQWWRGGVDYPAFEPASPLTIKPEEVRFAAGDHVMVRPPAEIRATLNDQMLNRGLFFEPDMAKHCGQRRCVHSEVRHIIDIVSGEMLTMKTPAYMLRDVHFSGERQQFNAQYEPLFWRGAWLRRDGD